MKLLYEYEYEAQRERERVLKWFGDPELMTFRKLMDCGFNEVFVLNEDGETICVGFRCPSGQDEPAYNVQWEQFEKGQVVRLDQGVRVGLEDIETNDDGYTIVACKLTGEDK